MCSTCCCSSTNNLSDSSDCCCEREVYEVAELVLLDDICCDLTTLEAQLQKDLIKNTPDAETKARILKVTLESLETVDRRLHTVLDELDPYEKLDPFMSNFGMTLKLQVIEEECQRTKDKLHLMRKEWYLQDDHIRKMKSKIKMVDKELEEQSAYCTTQGLILGRLLWKATKLDSVVELMSDWKTLSMEWLRLLDGCLYGYAQTYKNEAPDPQAEEYMYVLALCGILANMASIPDGRFFLMSQEFTKQVYDMIINIIPTIAAPKGEELKWMLLVCIYNIIICKEGQVFAQGNLSLAKALGACLNKKNSERILSLVLEILVALTRGIPNKSYLKSLNRFVTMNKLCSLSSYKGSNCIQLKAGQVINAIQQANKCFGEKTSANAASPKLSRNQSDSKSNSEKIKCGCSKNKM